VEIDTDRSPAVTTRLIDVPRRPFVVIRVDAAGFETPRALHLHCYERIRQEQAAGKGQRPVVIVQLRGRLRFNESDVQTNVIEDACRSLLDPLVVRVTADFDARDFVTEGDVESEQEIDRAFLERTVIQARLAQDERHAPRARELAVLAGELKERAVLDDNGDHLLEVFRAGMARIAAVESAPAEGMTSTGGTAR
jgi:hypothetical protein